jgi:hypothetical protein
MFNLSSITFKSKKQTIADYLKKWNNILKSLLFKYNLKDFTLKNKTK